MSRKYELKRRAETQQATRRRIVEAAIELHRTKGPARTTLSDVARLAGVQRHTLYRHFPDERALSLACSGLYMETNPPPDASSWHGIEGRDERLRLGLGSLYAWFEQVQDMLACVLRDAETDELTREMFVLRSGEAMGAVHGALAEVVPERRAALAALDLALDFRTWKRLRASGLTSDEAVETMVRAIACQ
jgi:AcrR family transcriptional regulator